MERRLGDSLLKRLGFDKPPQQRVRHKVWREQSTDTTRQLKLGADRAKQKTYSEMLEGTDVVRVVGAVTAEDKNVPAEVGAAAKAEAGAEAEDESEWEDWDMGDWVGLVEAAERAD